MIHLAGFFLLSVLFATYIALQGGKWENLTELREPTISGFFLGGISTCHIDALHNRLSDAAIRR
jgi:hypothetical protein